MSDIQSLVVDGVPKEGLRIQDVLVRIAVLLLLSKKVSVANFWILKVRLFTFFFVLNFISEKSCSLDKC